MTPLIRITLSVLMVSATASCSILAPIFGLDSPSEDLSTYDAAMADFSLCETAPNPADRAAAGARLAEAANTMTAVAQPTNPDHFYEMDRVVAASARCQEALLSR